MGQQAIGRRVFIAAAATCALSALLLQSCQGASGPYRPAQTGPFNIYMTLPAEPDTSAVIHYHTLGETAGSHVYYGKQPGGGDPRAYPKEAAGVGAFIEGLSDGRRLHRVALTGLEPDTVYYFITGGYQEGYSEERSFRTLPADGAPVRFVCGGDMDVLPETARMMEAAAAFSPRFAVLGGDMAHCNGELSAVRRWDRWFQLWDERMRTPQGRLVPIAAAPGNHEVQGGTVRAGGTPEERAPLYLAFFGGQGAEVYFSRDIGGMALLLMLDSSHVVPHTGPQLEWLGAELAANEDAPYKIAVYHKQLYPSHHAFDGDDATQGRAYWQPLFDQYGLDIAFEHHGHAFKRTVPLRGGEPDPAGTVYLGEGGWGVEPRRPDVDRGYLEQAAQRRHFWVVDVSPQALNCRAADEQGQVFDAYSVHPRAR